ncbi:MAG TPA: hypothetical protein VF533_04670, partial [Solirubrobacteraceae bacterium]
MSLPRSTSLLAVLCALALAATASADSDAPPLTTAGGDRMVVAWAESRDDDGSAIRLAEASAAGGIGEAQTVVRGASGRLVLAGVGRSAAGEVLVIWQRFPSQPEGGPPRSVVEAALRPPGGAFGPVQVLSSIAADAFPPAVAGLGERGDAVVAWSEGGRVHVAARPPGGAFAEAPAPPDLGRPLGVGVSRDGELVLAGDRRCDPFCDAFGAALRPAGGEFGPASRLGREQGQPDRDVVAMGPRGDAAAVTAGRNPAAALVARRPRGGDFAPAEQLDPASPGSTGAGVTETGETVVAWSRAPAAGVFASSARPGEPFAAPQPLTEAVAAAVQLGVAGDGAAMAAWSVFHEGVWVARRAPGAAFGPPVEV